MASNRSTRNLERLDDLHDADDDDFGGAEYDRQQRRRARKEERRLAEIYEQGRRDARSESRSRARGRTTQRAARELRRPVRSAAAGAVRIVMLTLGVIALYNALRATDAVAGVIGAVRGAVEWISDPATGIPYAGASNNGTAPRVAPPIAQGGAGGGGTTTW